MSSAAAIHVPTGLTTEGLLVRRYAARVIDNIIVTAMAAFVLTLRNAVFPVLPTASVGRVMNVLISFVLLLGYDALLESSKRQATFGKRITGLRVYDSHGDRLDVGRALARNLVKDGPFALIQMLPGANYFSMGLIVAHLIVLHGSAVSQAIHDRIAGTWVAAPEETIQLRLS